MKLMLKSLAGKKMLKSISFAHKYDTWRIAYKANELPIKMNISKMSLRQYQKLYLIFAKEHKSKDNEKHHKPMTWCVHGTESTAKVADAGFVQTQTQTKYTLKKS